MHALVFALSQSVRVVHSLGSGLDVLASESCAII